MPYKITQRILSSIDPENLEITLLPTEQCNFRCTYCYEDFSIGKMNRETINSIKNLLVHRVKTIKRLNLQWFGGEPLAAKSIMYEISAFAKTLCAEHGVFFSGATTTNGYLLDIDTATRLHDLDQRGYQISLDGFASVHDSTRRLASGDGTFDRIINNLRTIRDSKLPISVLLRIHLSIDNQQSLKQLAKMLRSEFLHDKRFSIFLKPIENLGGPNSSQIKAIDKDNRKNRIQEIEEILYNNVVSTNIHSVENLQICYASKPNSLVIRADGRVQKCTVLLSDDRNTVGNLTPDGRIHLNNSLMVNWMRGYLTGDRDILRCPAINIPKIQKSKIIPISQVV
ncbi:radical SAM protein [Delftia acidovorans]|uniref:radical SAM protein n=1 Tax=Delftia acidovorans TaxID=80866 RepID=UPI00333F39F9